MTRDEALAKARAIGCVCVCKECREQIAAALMAAFSQGYEAGARAVVIAQRAEAAKLRGEQ